MSWRAPVIGPESAPFWGYARAHELRVQRCTQCGYLRLPPGPVCPACFAEHAEWVAVSGHGVLQGWVTFHRQYEEAFPVPYTVGLIELDEGPRLEAPLVGVLTGLRWRMPVTLAWVAHGNFVLPGFELVAGPDPSDQRPEERA